MQRREPTRPSLFFNFLRSSRGNPRHCRGERNTASYGSRDCHPRLDLKCREELGGRFLPRSRCDEALCVVLHTHPPVGDWMVRAPKDEELKQGGCCPRSTATTMEGKSGATGGSHKSFFLLKTTTIFHCTIASCMPWCSLPWKRNEFQSRPAPPLSLTTRNICCFAKKNNQYSQTVR